MDPQANNVVPQPKRRYKLPILISVGITIAACVGCLAIPQIFLFIKLQDKQQSEVNWVIAHKYPNSDFLEAEAAVGDMPTGFNIAVSVSVTFASTDTFGMIKNWYKLHPEGGRDSPDYMSLSEDGLEKVSEDAGKTIYRVPYVEADECGWLIQCDQDLHRIR